MVRPQARHARAFGPGLRAYAYRATPPTGRSPETIFDAFGGFSLSVDCPSAAFPGSLNVAFLEPSSRLRPTAVANPGARVAPWRRRPPAPGRPETGHDEPPPPALRRRPGLHGAAPPARRAPPARATAVAGRRFARAGQSPVRASGPRTSDSNAASRREERAAQGKSANGELMPETSPLRTRYSPSREPVVRAPVRFTDAQQQPHASRRTSSTFTLCSKRCDGRCAAGRRPIPYAAGGSE